MPTDTEAWSAVQRRDARFDRRFVYAVRTTGVYCRPSCASRRPLRPNVAFFESPSEAEDAGFRACRRCDPRADRSGARVASAVDAARTYLDQHAGRLVPLAELAEH
ncbi:MAG TPA: Ada metal-binding domain-containing protein, partial [Gemmatimonadaceae bacterium]|nr:Ada metal-binding domain-containing protein [Gemmatimonadaceae bacterium]